MNVAVSFARAALALSVGLASASGQARTLKPPPTPDSLAAITRRGAAIAQYDFAAWHATDAVMALRPTGADINAYVARQVDSIWTVAFGRLSATKDTFFVAYEAKQVAAQSDSFTATRRSTADTGYYARAARSLEIARADFGKTERPYNIAIIPADKGEWFVYLMPAQTRSNLFPLGADVRYRVSADGRTMRDKRQLHNAIIEFGPASVRQMGSLVAAMHTAVVDDYPEDTDVFHVLARSPSVAECIVSDAFVFTIQPNGMIRYVGRREDVLGK